MVLTRKISHLFGKKFYSYFIIIHKIKAADLRTELYKATVQKFLKKIQEIFKNQFNYRVGIDFVNKTQK